MVLIALPFVVQYRLGSAVILLKVLNNPWIGVFENEVNHKVPVTKMEIKNQYDTEAEFSFPNHPEILESTK